MNYSQLKEVMTGFHLGTVSRVEMVAAIALWQRPVDCAENKRSALEAIIR